MVDVDSDGDDMPAYYLREIETDEGDMPEHLLQDSLLGGEAAPGDALFAALAGSSRGGCGSEPRSEPRRAKCLKRRALEDILREAIAVMGQGEGAHSSRSTSSCGSSECDGSRQVVARRTELPLARATELAGKYVREREVAMAMARRKQWAAEWAMRECPERCQTVEDKFASFVLCAGLLVKSWSATLMRPCP